MFAPPHPGPTLKATSPPITTDFHLLLAGGTSDQTADGQKIDRGTAGGEATALLGATAVSFPLLFAGAAMISQSTEIRRNFVGKEMPDQTLSPGQIMEGFIYYTPVPKGKNWSRGATIKVNLTDTRTHQTTGFDVSLGQ